MEKIIPRWEWRTFGDKFEEQENLIQQNKQLSERESEEIYILSQKSDDNTKIRDQLMDIKSPLRINPVGLEQWTVIMKAGFPIHINDLAVVYKAFGLNMPYLEKDEYSYEEYIENLIKKNRELTLVNVKKHRFGYEIDGAIVEIADVSFNDKTFRTVAVEHKDPDLVIKVLKKLQLYGKENINYIKAMKTLTDLGSR